jgi:hypothetical protein
MMLSES